VHLTAKPDHKDRAALYHHRKWQLISKSQWCCSATVAVHCTC